MAGPLPHLSRQRWLAVACCVIGAVASVVLTLAFLPVFRTMALPFATAAQIAVRANALVSITPDASSRARARDLALRAYRRDPTEVAAIRVLAVVAGQGGEEDRSRRLFRASEALSRRDPVTQLALIEDAVSRGRVAEALSHYNRALVTSPATGEALFPVLVSASANRGVMDELEPMLRRRPVWWPGFVDRFVASGDPQVAERIAGALRLRPDAPLEGWRLSALVVKLADAGLTPQAVSVARAAGVAVSRGVANGNFEGADRLPPFGWALIDDGDLAGVREARDGSGGSNALSIVGRGGRSGLVARQLLALRRGAYRLSVRAGALPDDGVGVPMIVLRCAGPNGVGIAQLRTGTPNQRLGFTVPTGCPGQWLEIMAQTASADPAQGPWIDDIRIDPQP